MSDLKTPSTLDQFSVDLGGDLITHRGGDPNIDTGGSSGLKGSPWENPIVPGGQTTESGNSVSGLPSTPSRFQPTETPAAPPSLKDRSPGTIDQR